jgi:hypothetical protein
MDQLDLFDSDPYDLSTAGPPPWRLPAYGSVAACSTCGEKVFSQQFHYMMYMERPCGRIYYERWVNTMRRFPPHVCRHCINCGTGWVETLPTEVP